ncbi:hypothetical protein EGW08_006532, partial [Elysia chlorotica]
MQYHDFVERDKRKHGKEWLNIINIMMKAAVKVLVVKMNMMELVLEGITDMVLHINIPTDILESSLRDLSNLKVSKAVSKYINIKNADILHLVEMGFPESKVIKALKATDGIKEDAVIILLHDQKDHFELDNYLYIVWIFISKQLYQYLNQRLLTLNDYCPICDSPHDLDRMAMLKPYICHRELCIFSFTTLGLMSDVADSVTSSPKVIDLLIHLTNCAAFSQRHDIILTPFPAFVDPAKPTELAMHEKCKDIGLLRAVLAHMPHAADMVKYERKNMQAELAKHDSLCFPLLRWIIRSNRSYIVALPEHQQINLMGTKHQFLMRSMPPLEERNFMAKRAIHGSTFAFQGVACEGDECIDHGVTRLSMLTFARAILLEDQIIFIFNHLVLSPDEVCGLILGAGCATPYFPGHDWTIKLPDSPKPPPRAPTVPKPDAPTVRVLHLTDIHLDPQYEQGSKAACNDPLCCRASSQTALTSKMAGKYGDYDHCDCPVATANDLFKHLRSIHDQYDYILFTGDIPAHDIWNQTMADQMASIRRLDRMFREFLPDKPIFQAVGNHESVPCNSFPPPGIPNQNSTWLFDTLVDVWRRWLPAEQLHTVATCGSYSHSPYPGFRLISVNNNYCNTLNFWLILNATDPCGTLQWLIQELQTAEDKSEKVHLLLHIPTGSSDCMKAWSWNFYKIVNRYENTIVNQFYGHEHRDYFQIFLDDTYFTRPTGVGFAAPSVTPYSATNPTFRIYTIDGNYKDSSW